ncbi:hypothetical protein JWJ88_11285 (plasmid) [Paracoccus methylovorus]|uniref:Uncharacterized protein n=1 Tax=Paracoccus methylovorus TaxID=2812658 RepID=A0ABX7JJQ4_9RHOB|nr:hypothetical protein [Paracoccus methylovorus]QRZ14470.1 hypothetical protein JWJ88_11285 [Paracoccus methylovorus]
MEKIEELFESIGDNCEFGFVQRRAGVESGGLLRWAISPPGPLAHAISTRFSEIYKFENLIPSSPRMVRDLGSGLAFHTKMYSQEGRFVAVEAERRGIWEEEFEKIKYLSVKLCDILKDGSKIITYKRNGGISEKEVNSLAAAIADCGPCKFLCVEEGSPNIVGTVTHVRNNLYSGKIDRFASYSEAGKCSYDVWSIILINMLALAEEENKN